METVEEYEGGIEQDSHEEEILDSEIPAPIKGEMLDAAIVKACKGIVDIKAKVKLLNAKKATIVEGMEAKGIPRKALANTLSNMEMTEDQRKAHDLGVIIARKAVGLPVQAEMF